MNIGFHLFYYILSFSFLTINIYNIRYIILYNVKKDRKSFYI